MLKKLLVIGLAISSSAASTPSCFFGNFDSSTPTLMCSDFSLSVPTGACKAFANPCEPDGHWVVPASSRRDAFGLNDAPAAIYLREEMTGERVERSLCAPPDAGDIVNQSVVFIYQSTAGIVERFGTGHVTMTVAPPLVTSASATPARIRFGERTQLLVIASGGIPPYSYAWIPRSGISSDTNTPFPTASPAVDEVYTVTVTDQAGQPSTTNVAVAVDYGIEITAIPSTINLHDTSSLGVSSLGGRPPYAYSWSPTETLSSATIQSPVATPLKNTTYTVVSTDANGAQRTGSVQVQVQLMFLTLSATPPTVVAGQSTQLETSAGGGDGVYTFLWSPATGLSDPHVPNPIAAPSTSSDYEVVVTDGQGASQRATIHVNVTPAAVLNAAFSFVRGALNASAHTIHWTFDASTSTGPVRTYTWHISRTDGTTVLDSVTAGPILDVDLPETVVRGNATLTVAAADGTTASTTQAFR